MKMQSGNDGTRTLVESIMVPEIVQALQDWKMAGGDGVLIGGLALSFYVKPRMTQDVDLLFISDATIPITMSGFKRTRSHAFQHNKTHVEIEMVTPGYVRIPSEVASKIIEYAKDENGIKVASIEGLIASKLYRLDMQDQADIVALVKHCIKNDRTIDLAGFGLPIDRIEKYVGLFQIAEGEID